MVEDLKVQINYHQPRQQGDEDDEVVYFVEEGSEEFAKGGKIKEGDLVCLAAFGSGFTWGSALLYWLLSKELRSLHESSRHDGIFWQKKRLPKEPLIKLLFCSFICVVCTEFFLEFFNSSFSI